VRGAASLAVVGLVTACAGIPSAQTSPNPETTSPIDALLAQYVAADEITAYRDGRGDESEELVAQCMRQAGFDYFLPEPEPEAPLTGISDSIPEDRLEWAQLYGYGQHVPLPPELSISLEPPPDPNLEHQATLSPEALAGYTDALWGPDPYWQGSGGAEIDWTTQGCTGVGELWKLEHDVYSTPSWTWVQDARNTSEDRALHDARVTEAVLALVTCMAQAGFPEVTSVWDEGNGFDFVQQQYAELMAASGKARVRDLDELGRLEIDVAVAEEVCARETGVRDVRAAVLAEYEQAFIESHRAELEEHLMAIAEMAE